LQEKWIGFSVRNAKKQRLKGEHRGNEMVIRSAEPAAPLDASPLIRLGADEFMASKRSEVQIRNAEP